MDGPATQPATQPFVDPRRHGHTSLISEQDECDVLCILRPASTDAHDCVRLVAETAPQHILQNHGLSYKLANDESNLYRASQNSHDEDMMDDIEAGVKPRDRNSPDPDGFDIALRMSSKLKIPGLGFTFGRSPNRCDILLIEPPDPLDETQIISSSHFRIYLNNVGVLMLEDTSTNGTIVDGVYLRMKPKEHETPEQVAKLIKRRMIANGSVILICFDAKKVTLEKGKFLRFIVAVPPRYRAGDRYQQKVADYLAYLQQVERQAILHARRVVEGTEGEDRHVSLIHSSQVVYIKPD